MDFETKDGHTALMLACSEGHAGVAKLLLDAGANLRKRNEHERAAANYAALANAGEVIDVLLAGRIVPNFEFEPLTESVTRNVSLFRIPSLATIGQISAGLAQRGVSLPFIPGPSDLDSDPATDLTAAIREACRHKDDDSLSRICDLLESHSIDPNSFNRVGQSALHIAAFHDNREAAELLLQHNQKKEKPTRDSYGRTLYYIACAYNNVASIRVLNTFQPALKIQLPDQRNKSASHAEIENIHLVLDGKQGARYWVKKGLEEANGLVKRADERERESKIGRERSKRLQSRKTNAGFWIGEESEMEIESESESEESPRIRRRTAPPMPKRKIDARNSSPHKRPKSSDSSDEKEMTSASSGIARTLNLGHRIRMQLGIIRTLRFVPRSVRQLLRCLVASRRRTSRPPRRNGNGR